MGGIRVIPSLRKLWRQLTSPNHPLPDEVWLYIVKDTSTGAVLSSDFAEHKVNERKFRRLGIGPRHAAMLRVDAAQCGLDDGWS